MKFSMWPQSMGLLKLMLNLFCRSTIEGRGLCWQNFMKYMLNVVMCQDTCELICFKLGTMPNTTILYSLIPVEWPEGHRLTGKVQLVQSLCCKIAWSNSNIHDGWFCKEDDCEKVLYVEWIWIVWAFALLDFLLLFCFIWVWFGVVSCCCCANEYSRKRTLLWWFYREYHLH